MKGKTNTVDNQQSVSISSYLNTNIQKGLDENEVVQRQKVFGLNEIEKQKRKSFFQMFLSQLGELMSMLLFSKTSYSL